MGLDEYESVLGIPLGPRPPNHYELLGLELFESKQSAISAAADGRIVEAEESVLASADQIRRVIEAIHLAKACLLDEQAKAEYDRQLNHRILGVQPDPVAGSSLALGSNPIGDAPHDALADGPQFEPLPADLITAVRPTPKRRSRRWFWAFTFVEGLCLMGLYLYLRPPEPVEMPKLAVRGRVAAGQPTAVSPPVAQPTQQPVQPPARDSQPPATSVASGEANDTDAAAVSPEPEIAPEAMPLSPASPGPAPLANESPESPLPETPANVGTVWPIEWKLQFSAYGDWTVETEMLSLNADEVKTLSALREQPLYTLRDPSTKKPIAALPFDGQGHLSGVALALLRKNDWHACLAYNNQVLYGRTRIFDAQRRCVYFGEYRFKGRARLLCLCAEGVPVAVQIWRGKDSVAYLIEIAEGRPIAKEQKQLATEQTERLAAALAELASIETLLRDNERDWKSQLTDWWKENDNALRLIALQPIPDSEKQSRRTAYYKKLFDDQHAGLDKLLAQFEPLPADPPVPKP